MESLDKLKNPQIFSASVFHSGLDGGSAPGNLSVDFRQVEFAWVDGAMKFPLTGLRVRLGGHDGRQVFFEHDDFPEWSIHTARIDVLDDLATVAEPGLRATVLRMRRKARAVAASVVLLVVSILIVVVALAVVVWQREALVRKAAAKVPVEWERKLGDLAFDQIKGRERMVNDPTRLAVVRSVADRLLPFVKDAGYTFQFHLVESTNINAFALPGGHVVIYTGLMDAAKRPEEIAGVLAHEIAHVTRRHSVRNLISAAGLTLIVWSAVGQTHGLEAVVVQGGQSLLEQKFSRDFEREADDVGWDYLVAANIDPRGLIDFFQRLREQEVRSDPAALQNSLALLSTHPATTERIARLEEKWRTAPRTHGFEPIGFSSSASVTAVPN